MIHILVSGVGIRVDGAPSPHRDMLYEAVHEAFVEAGVKRHDIDTAVTISSDLAEGRSLSNQYTLDSIGGVMRPFDLRLGNEALHGLAAGVLELLAGKGRRSVVAGVLRSSDLEYPEPELSRLIASRLNVHYERGVAEMFQGDLRIAMAQLMEREAGGQDVEQPPPPADIAVALVLERSDSSAGVAVEGVGWHDRPGWSLLDYEASVAAASEAAHGRAPGLQSPAWVEVPAYPPAVRQASLRALGLNGRDIEVNPSRRGSPDSSNLMMEGLLWVANSVRRLRGESPKTCAIVQSWQGFGTAATAVALLQRL